MFQCSASSIGESSPSTTHTYTQLRYYGAVNAVLSSSPDPEASLVIGGYSCDKTGAPAALVLNTISCSLLLALCCLLLQAPPREAPKWRRPSWRRGSRQTHPHLLCRRLAPVAVLLWPIRGPTSPPYSFAGSSPPQPQWTHLLVARSRDQGPLCLGWLNLLVQTPPFQPGREQQLTSVSSGFPRECIHLTTQ